MRLKILAVFLLVGVLFVSLDWRKNQANKEYPSDSLRMATNFIGSAHSLNLMKIGTIEEYELLRNLYSRLVEYNSDGQLIPALAESFRWENGKLIFTFSSKVKTRSGYLITAKDAEISLKRAMVKGSTGHGDLRNFICPDYKIVSIYDKCPGISVENNELILTPIRSEFGPFLLAILDSVDFSIVPIPSIESKSAEGKVINFIETSGPFFVDKDDPNGAWTLRVNPNHYHFSKSIPQVVNLIPTGDLDLPNALIQNQIDLIPTYMALVGPEGDRIIENSSSYSIHQSIPLHTDMIFFSPRTIHKFSKEQRLFVANVVSKYLVSKFPNSTSKPTFEFFQSFSEGGLNEKERQQIQDLRASDGRPKFREPMRLGTTERFFEERKKDFQDYPEIEIVKVRAAPYKLPLEERLDVYFGGSDSAWTETLSLLGYNFQDGKFHLPDTDADTWMKDYINTGDKATRIGKLRKLHYDLLSNVVIYPISVSPYFAVVRKPWQMEFSKYSAGTELWKIKMPQ